MASAAWRLSFSLLYLLERGWREYRWPGGLPLADRLHRFFWVPTARTPGRGESSRHDQFADRLRHPAHTTAAHELDSVTFPSGVQRFFEPGATSATCSVCQWRPVSPGDAGDGAATSAIRRGRRFGTSPSSTPHGCRGNDQPMVRRCRRPTINPGTAFYAVAALPMCQARTSTCTDSHDPHSYSREIPTAAWPVIARRRHGATSACGTAISTPTANTSGGIHAEIMGLHAQLYIRDPGLCGGVAGHAHRPMPARHPYFFTECGWHGEGENIPQMVDATMPTGNASWTPRLLKAAYNYQVATKDLRWFRAQSGLYACSFLPRPASRGLSAEVDIDMSAMQRALRRKDSR